MTENLIVLVLAIPLIALGLVTVIAEKQRKKEDEQRRKIYKAREELFVRLTARW